ncbi:MAG TPA: type III polyketide synthase [Lacipirellulaceae bacterium]|jgi:predicted naringenin-chalcone synthase
MSFQIVGLGTAVPKELVTQEDAARLAVELWGSQTSRVATIPALYRRAGVRTRHSVVLASSTNGVPATQTFYVAAEDRGDRGPSTGDRMRRYETEALELATRAADDALDDAGWDTASISHLVTVSCSGFSAPGVDIGLIERLGLRRDVSRTHIGFMGCHGALNGLRVAGALGAANPGQRVLVVCVELCSLHQQYTNDAQQIVANALFSDGAAAVVGTTTDVQDGGWTVVDQRSCLLPGTTELMSWRIGDHGFEMSLSPRVPELIRESLREWMTEWLAANRLAIDDIRGWAIHPGGPRILTACADALGLDHSQLGPSQSILSTYGNMSSPTVLFILEQLREDGGSPPCVVLAFGPGLTVEGALIC